MEKKHLNLINIKEKIINIDNILAHTHNFKQNETLIEHSELVIDYFIKLCKVKSLDSVVNNCINNLIDNNSDIKIRIELKNFIKDMFVNAIWLHDIGKINPKFQKYKMKNDLLEYERLVGNENHSLLSTLIYIQIYSEIIERDFRDTYEQKLLKNILYKFGYVISRHHSYLDNTDCFIDNLKDLQEEIQFTNNKNNRQGYLEYYIDKEKIINLNIENVFFYENDLYINNISMYILTKILFSTLTTCDFYATTEYMNGLKPQYNVIDNIDDLIDKYNKQKVTQSIIQYKKDRSMLKSDNINKYRSDMYLESEDNLLKNLDKYIYYLEAPTGSGKTNTGINLALQLIKNVRNINKFFYISPFNVIGVQTYNILKNIFGEDLNATVINSCSGIDIAEQDNDYIKLYSDRQHLHYPCVTTSHIRFFKWLTGINRDDLFPLLQLCNSVVILDEIQSYRNDIWTELIMLLNKYAELLNIKIIIMSATLPKLDELLEEKNDIFVDLIDNKRYYYDSEVFKNRVNLDFSMLDFKFLSLEDLADNIINKINDTIVTDKKTGKQLGKKVLIEFIKKKTADEFYNILKYRMKSIEVEKITNDEKGEIKQKIINKFNNKEDIILIATQCIEAGVDLDANIGFKDFSVLDSEEQFIGRVNRSFLKNGSKVYFFNWDNMNHYKGDLRKEINIFNKEFRQFLIDKNFNGYYKKVFKKIMSFKQQLSSKDNINQFKLYIKNLNYKKVDEYITLIENQNTYQIFLNCEVNIQQNNKYTKIKGEDVWNEIKRLKINKDKLEYCENQVKLINAYSLMNNFTYTCYYYKGNDRPVKYDDNINNTYYINDGDKYITKDGKLNRELLELEIIGKDNLFIA